MGRDLAFARSNAAAFRRVVHDLAKDDDRSHKGGPVGRDLRLQDQ